MPLPEIARWEDKDEIVHMSSDNEYAAVAIIFCDNKVVVEKRSTSKDDPWSGQFSLPGGHYANGDEILRSTAIRETLEETGIDLKRNAKYLGHFGPFAPGNRQNMQVYAYVFEIPNLVSFVPSSESEYLLWLELSELERSEGLMGISYKFNRGIIWGLTARIISKFLELSKDRTK